MKKFLAILVVFAMVAGVVFADNPELSVSVGGKASTNLFFAASGSGEWDSGQGGDDGSGKIHDLQKGSTDILSWNEGPGTDGWDATLGLKLSVENAEAGVDFILNKEGYNNFTAKNGDGDKKATIGDFLLVDGWHLSGTAGIFDAYIGTGGYTGKASAVGGVQRVFFDGDKVEGGNLDYAAKDGLFAVGIQPLELLKIAFGTGLGSSGGPNPWGSTSAINAAFLVSLINVADVVTFDVFYGIKGSDSNTLGGNEDTGAGYGTGSWNNRFGLYLDLNVVENLGIFVGYTAIADVNESTRGGGDDGKGTITINNPLYSGIDVNVSFKINDQLGVHLNNNLSFASAEGTDGKSASNTGLVIGDISGNVTNSCAGLGENEKEDYFVYVGELGGNYAVSDELGLSLTLTEKLGTYNYSVKDAGDNTNTSAYTKNYFEAFLKASYSIGPVNLSSGLALGLSNSSVLFSSDASGWKDITASLNKVTFSVPVFVTVAF